MRVHPAHRLYAFKRGLFFFYSPETEGEIFQTLTGDNLHGVFHVYVYHFCDFSVRDKVTKEYPQTTVFEEKGKAKQIRTEVHLLTSLTPYR